MWTLSLDATLHCPGLALAEGLGLLEAFGDTGTGEAVFDSQR